jgi:transposase-like protein
MDKSKEKSKGKFQLRQHRVFSVELKKKLVEQIETKKLKVRDVVNLYKVTDTSVYKWLRQYSTTIAQETTMVVESESQESKTTKLLQHIAELEQNVGKKQLKIEFLEKVLDICSEELGYDVKKKYST